MSQNLPFNPPSVLMWVATNIYKEEKPYSIINLNMSFRVMSKMKSAFSVWNKMLDYTSSQTNKQAATLGAHTHALCVYIFLVTPRRSVTSKLICPPAMRHDTKLFISLFLSVSRLPSLSFSLSLSSLSLPPVKPYQVCIKLNNALAWNWCLQSKSTPQPVLQEKAIMYPSLPLHPSALQLSLLLLFM